MIVVYCENCYQVSIRGYRSINFQQEQRTRTYFNLIRKGRKKSLASSLGNAYYFIQKKLNIQNVYNCVHSFVCIQALYMASLYTPLRARFARTVTKSIENNKILVRFTILNTNEIRLGWYMIIFRYGSKKISPANFCINFDLCSIFSLQVCKKTEHNSVFSRCRYWKPVLGKKYAWWIKFLAYSQDWTRDSLRGSQVCYQYTNGDNFDMPIRISSKFCSLFLISWTCTFSPYKTELNSVFHQIKFGFYPNNIQHFLYIID